jgi:quercetin dioxygenase-like cupin family protein
MRVNHGRVANARSVREGRTFTGEVWVDPVLDESSDVMAYNVFFAPQARTDWHRHTDGQILFITGGSGRVASRAGGVAHVRAGDVVWSEPGEEHWHGADEDNYMVHIAVSLGTADWLEPVALDGYEAGTEASP